MLYRKNLLRSSVAALVIGLNLAACEDTSDPEPEPEVVTMRLTIAGTTPQIVTVNNSGVVTGGPISIKVNTATTVTAEFLKADGTIDALAHTDEFQLNLVELLPVTITFTRTSERVIVLTGTATTTSGSGKFGLFHIEEAHFDWGEWTIPISVVP